MRRPIHPIIGITSDYNGGDRPEFGGREATAFIRNRYLHAIEATGGVPLVLAPVDRASKLADAMLDRIDGLLLTGSGPDIDPARYGERQKFKFKKVSPKRSDFEWKLAEAALQKGTPILGICGGMQLLNVVGGGTLYQDIQKQLPGALRHQRGGRPAHLIEIQKGSLLSRIVGRTRLRVNSSHHQGVHKIAPGYRISAVALDGVVEGIEAVEAPFIFGVQWHPEYLNREDRSRTFFAAFLAAAARFRSAMRRKGR